MSNTVSNTWQKVGTTCLTVGLVATGTLAVASLAGVAVPVVAIKVAKVVMVLGLSSGNFFMNYPRKSLTLTSMIVSCVCLDVAVYVGLFPISGLIGTAIKLVGLGCVCFSAIDFLDTLTYDKTLMNVSRSELPTSALGTLCLKLKRIVQNGTDDQRIHALDCIDILARRADLPTSSLHNLCSGVDSVIRHGLPEHKTRACDCIVTIAHRADLPPSLLHNLCFLVNAIENDGTDDQKIEAYTCVLDFVGRSDVPKEAWRELWYGLNNVVSYGSEDQSVCAIEHLLALASRSDLVEPDETIFCSGVVLAMFSGTVEQRVRAYDALLTMARRPNLLVATLPNLYLGLGNIIADGSPDQVACAIELALTDAQRANLPKKILLNFCFVLSNIIEKGLPDQVAAATEHILTLARRTDFPEKALPNLCAALANIVEKGTPDQVACAIEHILTFAHSTHIRKETLTALSLGLRNVVCNGTPDQQLRTYTPIMTFALREDLPASALYGLSLVFELISLGQVDAVTEQRIIELIVSKSASECPTVDLLAEQLISDLCQIFSHIRGVNYLTILENPRYSPIQVHGDTQADVLRYCIFLSENTGVFIPNLIEKLTMLNPIQYEVIRQNIATLLLLASSIERQQQILMMLELYSSSCLDGFISGVSLIYAAVQSNIDVATCSASDLLPSCIHAFKYDILLQVSQKQHHGLEEVETYLRNVILLSRYLNLNAVNSIDHSDIAQSNFPTAAMLFFYEASRERLIQFCLNNEALLHAIGRSQDDRVKEYLHAIHILQQNADAIEDPASPLWKEIEMKVKRLQGDIVEHLLRENGFIQ